MRCQAFRMSAPAPVSRTFAALRIPGYQAHFSTYLIAMMADNIEHVISYWMVFQKFHSPALGDFAVLSHWLPFLLFSVPAGAHDQPPVSFSALTRCL